jgi:flagellar basal body-associated protein FliL
MAKLVLIGVWACLMTLASSYAATYWMVNQTKLAAAEQSSKSVEYKKTKEFTVPKISNGEIQGYIVAQLSYSVDLEVQKTITAPPETVLLDEAFRYIYNDDSVDFNDLKKYDLQKMTKSLIHSVNARLNGNLVKDVLIQEFNYMSKMDVKKQL